MRTKFYSLIFLVLCFNLPLLAEAAETVAISSYEELNTLVRSNLNGSYYLTQDIVVPDGAEWLPIGMPAGWDGTNNSLLGMFKGTFDGKGYAVKNLKITSGKNFAGLFARLSYCTIKNLGIENVDITGGNPTGALAGTMFGDTQDPLYNASKPYDPSVLIENVYVTGKVKGTTQVGGLIGRNNNSPENIIRNCYVSVEVEATNVSDAWVGGLVGCMDSGQRLTIENIFTAGTVKTTQNTVIGNVAGGILGYINNTNVNTIFKCNSSAVMMSFSGGANRNVLNRGKLGGSTIVRNCFISDFEGMTSNPDATARLSIDLQTQTFYQSALGWNFDTIWMMGTTLPVFSWKHLTSVSSPDAGQREWSVTIVEGGFNLNSSVKLPYLLIDVTGKIIDAGSNEGNKFIPLNKGIYFVKVNKDVQKLMIM